MAAVIGGLHIGFFYLASDILLPFIVAFLTAYFLDPVVDVFEEKLGLSRNSATLSVTTIFFLIVATLLILIVPLLYNQLSGLIDRIPKYMDFVEQKVIPEIEILVGSISPDVLQSATEHFGDVSKQLLSVILNVASNMLNSGIAIVNMLSLMFITPIVSFYLMREWDTIVANLNRLLPPKHAPVIREQLKEIDKTLSAYIRGQTNVCLLLGTFYAIGLTIAGLEFGLFIGFATGILSFIPYVGMLFGFIAGMVIAFLQFGDLMHMLIIAGIFVVGQMLEGTFITPNLVGNEIGLHPVWIIFALLSGGSIFGFIGILIAIPAAAAIAVLVRFSIKQYLNSSVFPKKPARKRKTRSTTNRAKHA